ncbi:hypothetical protein OPT61_g7905 [Boeremia exigua]|uniref:Uncharacterized protein n=1 Tax=Boeremia exigua TaxID=749465 RepID=A0ACC2I0H5_9PLEO|nr:hypothetical protein OPT61_g7905 [Boeremia exigua]
MKFTALTLLALGASATAYVVNDKQAVTDNAVAARVVGSGPVRASALVAAMQARDPEPHHKGRGGNRNNKP